MAKKVPITPTSSITGQNTDQLPCEWREFFDKLVKKSNEGSDAWEAYTPTVTSGSGTLTTVSAIGYYTQIGKTIHFQITITIITNGTGATNLFATIPAPAKRVGWQGCGKSNVPQKSVFVNGTTTNCGIRYYDGTYPGADGAVLHISGTYEAA